MNGPHPLVAALRDERERRDFTQAAFARRIGWSLRTIASTEAGRVNPTLAFVEDYAAGLGIGVALVRDGAVLRPVLRVESRRVCAGCGVSYQVTGAGVIRKHGCTA